MDLTSATVGLKHAEIVGQVQYAVARKILDDQKSQASAALKLIESASSAGTRAGDALIAAATGLGGQLDTFG